MFQADYATIKNNSFTQELLCVAIIISAEVSSGVIAKRLFKSARFNFVGGLLYNDR